GTVWNLAVYLTHRNQDLDQDVRQSLPLGDPKTDEKKAGQQLVRRDFSTNVADFWGKLSWRHFLFEGETALLWDHIGNVDDGPLGQVGKSRDIFEIGAVGRLTHFPLPDMIRLKLEPGFASGDQVESPIAGLTNSLATPIVQPIGDGTISNF